MELRPKIKTVFFILLLCISVPVFSQDSDSTDAPPPPVRKKSKFLTGLYVGSYFANKYSASTYNGYGFDVHGNRNSFGNSFMYQKIVNQYGGYGAGTYDYIAQALGVDQNQWAFTESDMATNMHYVPAISVGANFKIPVAPKHAIIFNINGIKLGIEGNFTMSTLNPPSANPATNTNIKTFTIKGGEQRLQFQLGYQKILGDDDKLNFFVEAGLVGTLTKFDRNLIYINNLTIDLTSYYNQTLYASPGPTKRPVGFGMGAFAGAGINIEANPKITVQILYTPSLEKINIGTNPKLKLQNAVGLRVYYNF